MDIRWIYHRRKQPTLNFGFDTIFLHAAKTSIFSSLWVVEGNNEPRQLIIDPCTESDVFLRVTCGGGANGEGPESSINLSISDLFFGHLLGSWTSDGWSTGVLSVASEPDDPGEDEEYMLDTDPGEWLAALDGVWWWATGLRSDWAPLKTIGCGCPKYGAKISSSEAFSGFVTGGEGQDDIEPISKLKVEGSWTGGVAESNVDAYDMKAGLLAMVVYGVVLNPKSIILAVLVAVDCGWSSSKFNIAGSNDVRELQSNGLAIRGPDRSEAGEDTFFEEEGWEFGVPSRRRKLPDGEIPTEMLPEALGAEKVNGDCFKTTFSDCRRWRRSRRFSFSAAATSFLASSSATLSSS